MKTQSQINSRIDALEKELAIKNRELEIEAALERVRTVAMSMKEPADMLTVCKTISHQLDLLGVKEIRNVQTAIFYENKGTYMNYEYYAKHDKTVITETSYTNHKIPKAFANQMLKGSGEIFITHIKGKEIRDWIAYQKTTNVFIDDYLYTASSLNYYWHSLGPVALGISTYEPLSEEEKNLFNRFLKVFELAYRRYLDIEQAEAQAREAQIELALERVRARTMAMQKSDELSETAYILFQQFKELGENPLQIMIGIFNEEKRVVEFRITGLDGSGSKIDHAYNMDIDEPVLLHKAYTAWKEQKKSAVIELTGKDLRNWSDYKSKIGGVAKSASDINEDERRFAGIGFFSKGMISFSRRERIPEETIKILERFTTVFNQTYTRFLDLQKAEAQTREAKIEAALERVRAKAMAMHKSEDLSNAIATVFEELDKLDIGTLRCGISIINKEKRTTNIWSTTKFEKNSTVQVTGDESMDIHPLLQGAYNAWLKLEDFSYVLQGEDLNTFYTALSATNFKLPNFEIAEKENEERQYLYVAHFPSGGLYAFRKTPFSEEAKTIIKRFAHVFNLTYTRFNDLKIAEAHALQAELDLIEIKAAKKKAEDTLTELKSTQAQLIQSEKMASLGELTAGIAHEIQNPLNFVNNFSEVNRELIAEMKEELDKGNYDEVKLIATDVEENEEKILHHGKRADAIVKGMLQHSRASTGKKEPTDINSLTEEYLRLSYHGLRAKDKSFNATLQIDFDSTIEKINVVPQDIGRVLLNLFNNAFYAVHQKQNLTGFENLSGLSSYKPAVSVCTKKVDGKIEIYVRDNGNGVPQKVVDKIFQPFFTTKPTGQGTGLGLSLSYDIIKAHGGEIKVESNEGEGAEFVILLPS